MKNNEGNEEIDQTSEEEKTMHVDVVRHAPSRYTQPEWRDVESADDIFAVAAVPEESEDDKADAKEKARQFVRESAEKIADDVGPDEEVAIWSSATGRTIETAKIISEVFQERGIHLRRKGVAKGYGIKIFNTLGELKDFTPGFYCALLDGGNVNFEGVEFTIDKADSNPDDLDSDVYYASDAIAKIPEEVRKKWPARFYENVSKIEKYASANKRIVDVLRRLRDVPKDKNYRVIIVTHRGPSAAIVETFTAGALAGLDPAKFIALERKEGKMVATQANELNEGDSATDVIEDFERKYANLDQPHID